jgi:hypothetical protein
MSAAASIASYSDRALMSAIDQLTKWREWPLDWTKKRLTELKTELRRREREDAEIEDPAQYQ